MATPEDDKLAALEEEIEEARRRAEDDGLIEDPDRRSHPFFESPEGDTITPPG